MKYIILLILLLISPTLIIAQNLDVEGQVKIGTLNLDNTADSLVVVLADSTLAKRAISSLPDSSGGGWLEVVDTSSTSNMVGIGVSEPTEKLEVDGAINIGANLDSSPEAGTIRWNENTQDFEGYTGTEWKSLTQQVNVFGSSDFSYNSTEKTKLTASDAAANDQFGRAVAIYGGYAVVGAYLDDDTETNSGSAYIYIKSGDEWVEQAKLNASDPAIDDYFGRSVAISENYAVVGAYLDDETAANSGSVYIFERTGSTWTEQDKITASDPEAADFFGRSVSISGDYIIVGSYRDDDDGDQSGSAYIFKRSGTVWNEEAKITASDAAAGDEFGFGVSINGDYAIVGANLDDDNGSDSGSAYVFLRSGTTWSEQAKLTASDGAADDFYGRSVSIFDNYAVVGAFQDDDAGGSSGSAYVYVRSGTTWTEQTKLTASDAGGFDNFGFSVSISGEYIAVGAYANDDTANNSGSAYVFKRSGTSWSQEAKLTATDPDVNDNFGRMVSISGGHIIIGAYRNDDDGGDSGSAYIF